MPPHGWGEQSCMGRGLGRFFGVSGSYGGDSCQGVTELWLPHCPAWLEMEDLSGTWDFSS